MDIKNINEIVLNSDNAVPINSSGLKGSFVIDDKKYIFITQQIPSPFIDRDIELNGLIYNIAFLDAKDTEQDVNSYTEKGGKINLLKIYSTMYKVILEFIKTYNPDYFIISSLDTTKYFPIYSDLIKKNKIPGYHKKTVVSFRNYSEYPMTGIVLSKTNSLTEIKQITIDFQKKLKI